MGSANARTINTPPTRFPPPTSALPLILTSGADPSMLSVFPGLPASLIIFAFSQHLAEGLVQTTH